MPIVIPAVSAASAAGPTTLRTLRTALAKQLHLLAPEDGAGIVSATGTEPAAGYVDDTNPDALAREALSGAWVLFSSGANSGSYRLLAGNQDGEISLANAVANPIAAGDTYEIYRRFPPPVFRDALNYAIGKAYPLIYSSWEQEVPEDPNTLEYEYPALAGPVIDSVIATAPGAGHTYSYQLVGRTDAGDSLAGTAVQVTSGAALTSSSYNTVSWTEPTNLDSYIVLRAVDGGAYLQLTTVTAVAGGQVKTVLDQGQYSAAVYAALQPNPPSMLELRQLWRRTNPSTTGQTISSPPVYAVVPGSQWQNLGDRVRVHYRTASGMFLTFVGMAAFAQLTNDTDKPSALLPSDLLLAGGAVYLYLQMLEGEASSARGHYEKRIQYWSQEFTRLNRQYAMPQLGQELHPPRHQIVRAPYATLGPTYR